MQNEKIEQIQQDEKKSYSTPQLTPFGAVEDITEQTYNGLPPSPG
jgi:hypothetical protein